MTAVEITLRRWLERIVLTVAVWLTGAACWFVFCLANRLHVRGPRRRLRPGLLIVSNHQSMLDSFLVGSALYFPQLMWAPNLTPHQLADEENFMQLPVLSRIFKILRVIPVKKTAGRVRRDPIAFRRAVKVLRSGGIVHVYIEGTRSRSEQLLPPVPEVGAIALLSGATVRPVYLNGMHRVQPYRKDPGDGPPTWWRRLSPRVEWVMDVRAGHDTLVNVGDDISPTEAAALAGCGDNRERSDRLARALMERISLLKGSYKVDGTFNGRVSI